MIAFIGDVHEELDFFRARIESLPSEVHTIIQVGDIFVWPRGDHILPMPDGTARDAPQRYVHRAFQWERPTRDVCFLDGNHHQYWLTRGVQLPSTVAPGLRFLPRGTVHLLQGVDGPLRVGILGGADSVVDAVFRRPDVDWWPAEERIDIADVERLLNNARAVGGLDLLVTHTPPATITHKMTRGGEPHPSSFLVEEAWRALGGGIADPPLELIAGHMHDSWRDSSLRVQVLDILEVTLR